MENNNKKMSQSLVVFDKQNNNMIMKNEIKVPIIVLLCSEGVSPIIHIGYNLILGSNESMLQCIALTSSIISPPQDASLRMLPLYYSLFNSLGNMATIVTTICMYKAVMSLKTVPDVAEAIRKTIVQCNNTVRSLFVAELANNKGLQESLITMTGCISNKLLLIHDPNNVTYLKLKEGNIIEYKDKKFDINFFEEQYMKSSSFFNPSERKIVEINFPYQTTKIGDELTTKNLLINPQSRMFFQISFMTGSSEFFMNTQLSNDPRCSSTKNEEIENMLFKYCFISAQELKVAQQYIAEHQKESEQNNNKEDSSSGDEDKSSKNKSNENKSNDDNSNLKQNSDNGDTTESCGNDVSEKNIVLTIQAPQDERAIYQQLQKDINTEGEKERKETMEKVKDSKDLVEGATYDILLMQLLTKITPPSISSEFEEPENHNDAKEFSIHSISSGDNILQQFDGGNMFEIPVHA